MVDFMTGWLHVSSVVVILIAGGHITVSGRSFDTGRVDLAVGGGRGSLCLKRKAECARGHLIRHVWCDCRGPVCPEIGLAFCVARQFLDEGQKGAPFRGSPLDFFSRGEPPFKR